MSTSQASGLTNLQRELLKVFSVELSESQLLDIRTLLTKYFAEMATNRDGQIVERAGMVGGNDERMGQRTHEN